MKYYKYLYTSDNITKVDKLKAKLNLHKGMINIYLISLCPGTDQLEIMEAYYLKLKYYREHPPVVVGLAKGKDKAVDLVVQMMNESMEKTGYADIKEYLKLRVRTKDFTKNADGYTNNS